MANTIAIITTSSWSLEEESTKYGFSVIVLIEGLPVATPVRCTVPFAATYAEVMAEVRVQALAAGDLREIPFAEGDALRILGGPQPTLADLGG